LAFFVIDCFFSPRSALLKNLHLPAYSTSPVNAYAGPSISFAVYFLRLKNFISTACSTNFRGAVLFLAVIFLAVVFIQQLPKISK